MGDQGEDELIENLKEIIDTRIKRVPDIDLKINEELEFVRRFEEQWVKTVRDVAVNVDEAAAELSRTFISPEERPFVGIPEPVIEDIVRGKSRPRKRIVSRRRSSSPMAALAVS